jgi:CRISPR-associated protein Csm2
MKVKFWADSEKNKIDPKLFSDKAEDFAGELNRSGGNKRSQLRKFYDEVLRLNALAQERPQQWEAILPQVHMLAAKAAYAKGRNLVSDGFIEFIREAISQVDEAKDLKVFANFFEATMGFYRVYGNK